MQNTPPKKYSTNGEMPARPVRRRPLTPAERKRRRRRRRIQQIVCIAIFLLIFILLVAVIVFAVKFIGSLFKDDVPETNDTAISDVVEPPVEPVIEPVEDIPEDTVYEVYRTAQTAQIETEFPSEFAILVDMETGEVIAEKNSQVQISPASMCKILTLLVAVENIEDTSGTFTMNIDITDYCFVNDCSVVGYKLDEVIPIEELFYGCILCSGADACLALADLAAGSHEAFVELMNAKLEELGLSDTAHFVNCVGIYDKEHYCTVEDMAVILQAALQNEKCREVLSTRLYYSEPTEQHPEGQDLSNWFIRRIEDKDAGNITVLGGKTGFVNQSGSCAASFGETEDRKIYICVTGNAYSSWRALYDHVDLYTRFC